MAERGRPRTPVRRNEATDQMVAGSGQADACLDLGSPLYHTCCTGSPTTWSPGVRRRRAARARGRQRSQCARRCGSWVACTGWCWNAAPPRSPCPTRRSAGPVTGRRVDGAARGPGRAPRRAARRAAPGAADERGRSRRRPGRRAAARRRGRPGAGPAGRDRRERGAEPARRPVPGRARRRRRASVRPIPGRAARPVARAGPAVGAPCSASSSRAGCDTAPVDGPRQGGRLLLTSYVWPDQTAPAGAAPRRPRRWPPRCRRTSSARARATSSRGSS